MPDRPESVVRHLLEYFCRPERDFPAALQRGLRFVSPTSKTAQMISKKMGNNIKKMTK